MPSTTAASNLHVFSIKEIFFIAFECFNRVFKKWLLHQKSQEEKKRGFNEIVVSCIIAVQICGYEWSYEIF